MMEELDEAMLFVAATRPALLLGLPFGIVVLFLVALGLIMVILENPFYELFLIPVWFIARQLVRYDYNAVRVFFLWADGKGRSFDAHNWGGASPASLPIRLARWRGIAGAW
jgi:type IV secretion system protein VirB3